MKTFLTITIIFLAAVNITSAQITIYSTTTGGYWNDNSTWTGGSVPDAGQNAVINGTVVILNYDNKCLNVTVNPGIFLGGVSGYYGQLTVNGSITNNGTIGGGANIDLYGNLTNNGTWGNEQFRITLRGTNQTITCADNSSIGATIIVPDSATNVIMGSDLHLIVNGNYNCNFGNSELFTQGHDLTIDNGQFTNARVTTDDTLTFNYTILSTVVINGNYFLKGNIISFDNNIFKGTITNSGNITNLTGYSTVLTIEGNILNYGTLQHSDVYIKKNASNYGTWYNQMTRFTGPGEKVLINSAGHPFGGVQMRIEDTAATVKLGSDAEITAEQFFLENGKINCNGHTLNTSTVYHNGRIYNSNKIRQHGSYENVILDGPTELYGINNMMYSTINGNITNYDTVSVPYLQSGNVLSVNGHFINKGIYHTLYMDLIGDLTNHGSIYDNSMITVNGTQDQTINISQPVNSEVRIYPKISGTTYQWLKNGEDIPGEQSSMIIFTTLEFTNAGVYKCRVITGGSPQYSREITINRVTGIEQENENTLNDFTLYQNYPNPFNPSTRIRFTIPEISIRESPGAQVQLKVFDLLGREVAVLVNEYRPAGNYEVEFATGINLQIPSGVYYYQLKAGDYKQTRKMILIR